MEGGREQNYWPGFVDALSNVVLTLVFVLVIFVFALAITSNRIEQRLAGASSDSKQKEQETVVQQNDELRKKLEDAQSEIVDLKSVNATLEADKKTAAQTSQMVDDKETQISVSESAANTLSGAPKISQSEDNIVIKFPVSVADMDDKAQKELEQLLEAARKKGGKKKVLLRSILGQEPFSAAQRLAYYRALTVRNYMITKGIAEGQDITATIVQPPKPEDGRVEIVFQR